MCRSTSEPEVPGTTVPTQSRQRLEQFSYWNATFTVNRKAGREREKTQHDTFLQSLCIHSIGNHHRRSPFTAHVCIQRLTSAGRRAAGCLARAGTVRLWPCGLRAAPNSRRSRSLNCRGRDEATADALITQTPVFDAALVLHGPRNRSPHGSGSSPAAKHR